MLHHREHNAVVGRSLQKRCGEALAKRKAARMYKRAYNGLTDFNRRDTNDSVCLLTPEVTQGPYHILGEVYRQNITQGQGGYPHCLSLTLFKCSILIAGIPFEVDVDFIDITTCEPVSVSVSIPILSTFF